MRQTDTKSPHYSMLLICEGNHTEPNFFGGMIEDFKAKEIINFEIEIKPKPTISESDNDLDLNRGGVKRKKRTLNNTTEEQQRVEEINYFPGEQPLNWVKAGIEALNVYNEVWVFFDKDGHPKTKEAFEMAREEKVDGKKINIGFSSRCFEYYLLLHFELIYNAFEKSECNGKEYPKRKRKSKTISYHCMTDRAVEGKACQGDKCINGYARLKEYWQDSKGSFSMYTLVKDKLWVGICNAHSIRWQSNLQENNDYYERNPYVDVDKFVCRLMEYSTIEPTELYTIAEGINAYTIKRKDDIITLTLENKSPIIIPKGNIKVYHSQTGDNREIDLRIILNEENPSYSINLQEIISPDEYCTISIFSKKYFCTLLPIVTK